MICFQWTTYWPHAVPTLDGVTTTTERGKVTCPACIHALGHQKYDPPRRP